MGEYLWLLVAVVALIALVWRPAGRMIGSALDARATAVRQELDEAARLREEAQALLAQYQKQLHDGEARASAILKRAEEEAERQATVRARELEASLERRTDTAMRRIDQEQARAVHEVRARAASLAMQATRRLVAERASGDGAKAQSDAAIAEIRRILAPANG